MIIDDASKAYYNKNSIMSDNQFDIVKEYAEKRFQKLEKYFEKDFEVNATLSVEKDLHKIDVVLPLSGFVIKGEDKTRDMYSSIDNVIDKLERQIRKYKDRSK